MNPFQARGIQKASGVSNDHPSIAGERRQRPPSAIGERLGAIADHLAAREQSGNKGMLLERLKYMLRIEARIMIIEPGDEAERDDVVFRAVNPGAAIFLRG